VYGANVAAYPTESAPKTATSQRARASHHFGELLHSPLSGTMRAHKNSEFRIQESEVSTYPNVGAATRAAAESHTHEDKETTAVVRTLSLSKGGEGAVFHFLTVTCNL
jgi:hypothetical protein